jgi:hypothetical protein
MLSARGRSVTLPMPARVTPLATFRTPVSPAIASTADCSAMFEVTWSKVEGGEPQTRTAAGQPAQSAAGELTFLPGVSHIVDGDSRRQLIET